MADFKLCIADPKTAKCYQKAVKDEEAGPFLGLNIGENIKGDAFGMKNYEFLITGGSDYCGFPMRGGILGVRKKITASGGVGFAKLKKGMKKRKTVCGHKINEKISQINLKILKEGDKKIDNFFPAGKNKEEVSKEGEKPATEKPKKEKKKEEAPKEEKKEGPKEEKTKEEKEEVKKEEPKEEKGKEESPKEEKKKEVKPEKPKEEKKEP